MNSAAPERNLHHTRSGWQSEEEYYEEYQRDRAEAEYFAHVELDDYPLLPTNSILVGNESETGELPF